MRGAVVTGATSGIGRAAALALAEAGWWVLACGRDAQRGREVAGSLGASGEFLACELSERGAAQRIVATACERAGGLDLLVNNAATHFLATLPETEDADYDALMETNLHAAVRLTREALKAMRERGAGVVVNVSSEAGLVAVPGQVAYNISKTALLMLTRSIAADHAAEGIRAVSICPGTTRTPLVDEAIASAPDPEQHHRWLASMRPAGRLGRPEEIAAAIVFAASDQASFITGSEIVVDGGFTAV